MSADGRSALVRKHEIKEDDVVGIAGILEGCPSTCTIMKQFDAISFYFKTVLERFRKALLVFYNGDSHVGTSIQMRSSFFYFTSSSFPNVFYCEMNVNDDTS